MGSQRTARGGSAQVVQLALMKSTLLLLISFACFTDAAETAAITNISPRYGSREGGTLITITGAGFAREGKQGSTVVYIGNTICEQIEYYTSDTQIVCRTQPHPEMWANVEVQLIYIDKALYANCQTSCSFRFHWNETPYLREVTRSLVPGSRLMMEGYFRGTEYGQLDVRFDNALCAMDGDDDDTFADRAWHTSRLYCDLAEDITADRYNITLSVQRDDLVSYGYQYNDENLWTVPIDGGEPYTVTVHPEITHVSHHASGLLGGQTMTIKGRGFERNKCQRNKVHVAGVPCIVSSCARDELVCTVQPYVANDLEFHTPAGIHLRTWSGRHGFPFNPAALGTATHDIVGMSALEGIYQSSLPYYASEAVALFVPPITGFYTFYGRADDALRLRIGEDATDNTMQTVIEFRSYSSHFFVRGGQISQEVFLKAGQQYYTEVQHMDYGGGDFFFVSCAIRAQEPKELTRLQHLHDSVRERQRITFHTIVTREHHSIIIVGATGGSFFFYGADKLSRQVHWSSGTDHIAAAIRETLAGCNSVSVDVENGILGTEPARTYTVRINCPATTGFTMPTIIETPGAQLTGKTDGFDIVIERSIEPSDPVRGSFRVGLGSLWTVWLNWDAHVNTIAAEMETAFGFRDLRVSQGGNIHDGRTLYVDFYDPTGDVDTLRVDDSRLEGTNASMSVLVEQDGADNLFLDPIPAEYFERVYTDSSSAVTVSVNGIPAGCEGTGRTESPCAFEYSSDLTPHVVFVEAPEVVYAGNTIAIYGYNLVNQSTANPFLNFTVEANKTVSHVVTPVDEAAVPRVTVRLGVDGEECTVTMVSDTKIECTVPHTTAGAHVVDVVVEGLGRAEKRSEAEVTLNYGFRVDSVEPSWSGAAGGRLVTLRGTGFSDTSDDHIVFGGAEAQIVSSAHDHVVCVAPGLASDDSTLSAADAQATTTAAGASSSVVSVTIDVNSVRLSGEHNFTYDWEQTIVATQAFPSQIASAISTFMVFDGNFPLPASLVTNSTLCSPVMGTSSAVTVTLSGHRRCEQVEVADDGSYVSCLVVRGDALAFEEQVDQVPEIRVCTDAGIDLVRPEPSVRVDVAHRVTRVSPSIVGVGGGAVIEIHGQGFGDAVDVVGVLIKDSNATSTASGGDAGGVADAVACRVTSVSSTLVQCRMDAAVEPVPDAVLELQINGFVAKCGASACDFSILSTVTPLVLGFTNSTGSMGTLIRLSGERFQLDERVLGSGDFLDASTNLTGAPVVTVGYRECAIEHFSPTEIVCTVPALTAGVHAVVVHVDPVGAALVSLDELSTDSTFFDELKFVYPLTVSFVDTLTGSSAGGVSATLHGDGFNPHANALEDNWVYVGGTRAVVTGATYHTVTFVVPTLANQAVSSAVSADVSVIVEAVAELEESFASNNVRGAEDCRVRDECVFVYDPALSGQLSSVSPSSGFTGGDGGVTQLVLGGMGLLAGGAVGAGDVSVSVGGVACVVVADASASDTSLTCDLAGEVPAGEHAVIVFVAGRGVVRGNTMFTSQLEITSVAPGAASFAGGTRVTVSGRGFASDADRSVVTVCGRHCSVVSSQYNSTVCHAPAIDTPESHAVFGNVEATVLTGTAGGSARFAENAFDDDFSTSSWAHHGDRSTCSLLFDLGEGSVASLQRIRYFPKLKERFRAIGGTFHVSADNVNYTQVATISSETTDGWTAIHLDEGTEYIRYIRYNGPEDGYCALAEIEYIGLYVNTLSENNECGVSVGVHAPEPHASFGFSAREANAAVVADVQTAALPATMTDAGQDQGLAYSMSATPLISSVEPKFGSSLGGTLVTLRGERLPASTAGVTVDVNGYACNVVSASGDGSSLVCETTRRYGLNPRTLVVTTAEGHRSSSDPLVRFRYLDRWSEVNTWVNDEPPVAGDAVVIPPDQVVLMDVSPPRLFLLLVQGELVWDRQDGLELHSTYIWVEGGKFEVGTEEDPFLNTASITLYGDRFVSEGLPHMGAKMFVATNAFAAAAPHYGQGYLVPFSGRGCIDLHGRPRIRTWTKVASTVNAGDLRIHLSEAVDFEAGEDIVLTHHTNMYYTEELVVAGLEDDGRTIVLESPVQHRHVSGVYDVAGEQVDMRVEVGIISRNIVVQGQDGKSQEQDFGSHMMAALGARLRVENIEIRRCGQAGVLGRYCSHFHIGGDIRDSYIKSNSIHHSFQRAVTVHGTHRALVQNNVAYHVHGHTFFVEDGNEAFNVIEANLGVFTMKLHIMLKGDAKPATFWMSSPKNLWRDNVAAGCTNDGYWFELPGNPHGPSYTPAICPVHEHVIEFRNNTAHANGVHGLRIYPTYLPYVDPCDESSGPAPQYFYNFTSFYNGQHGIFGKRNGDLHHVNGKFVGNAQEEVFWLKFEEIEYRENDPNIVDCLFVNSVEGTPQAQSVTALMMPQNEFFHVSGATFVGYGESGAIAGCADCDSQTQFRQGGYTYRLQGLDFIDSAKYVKWTAPFKQIFHDLDGTLTGHVNGTATPYYAFNHYPGVCDHMDTVYDNGLVCDNSVRVRRLQIDGVNPDELDFQSVEFSQYDALSNETDATTRDAIGFRAKEFYGHAVPIVNRRAYYAGFVSLIDFRTMRIRYSEPEYLQYDEEHLELVWKYTDYRWEFEVTYADGELRPAASLITDLSVADAFGTGKINHNRKLWHVMLSTSGIDHSVAGSIGSGGPYVLTSEAIQCAPGACNDLFSTEPLYDPTYWSDLTKWCRKPGEKSASYSRFGESGFPPCDGVVAYPEEGDSVVLNSRMYVVLDMNPPKLGNVQVIGKLEFLDTADRLLEADNIEVWGTLQVGSPARPFTHEAVVRLYGERTSPTLIVHNSRFLGNKVLGVLGTLELHGQAPERVWERLGATASAGSTTLSMLGSVDWRAGDRLVVSGTEYDLDEYETVEVASVSADGLEVTLTAPLAHDHFADFVSTGGGDVELRAAVGKLNRNVRIEGSKGSGQGGDEYGAHVVIMDVQFDEALRVGKSTISGVEFQHCGQRAMEHACILYKYDHTYAEADEPVNELVFSSMSDGNNYGIVSEGSHGVVIEDNVIHRTFRDGIELDTATVRAYIRRNLLVGNHRSPDEPTDWIRPHAHIYADTQSVWLEGNVVSGGADTGFVVRSDDCSATASTARIRNNEAHGVLVGVFVLPESRGCLSLHSFTAWKAAHVGILTVDQRSSFEVHNSVVADCHIGVSPNFFNTALHSKFTLLSSYVLGSTPASTCGASLRCRAMTVSDIEGDGSVCRSVFGNKFRRVGLVLPQVTNRGKTCLQDNLPVCRPPTVPERLCGMGWERRYGLPGTQHTELHVIDTHFAHFASSDCQMKSVGITVNPTQRNYSPEQFYSGVTWHNVEASARFQFGATSVSAGECETGCDSLTQLLAHDSDGTLTGLGAGVVTSGENPGLVDGHERCTTLNSNGAFHCHSMPLRQVTFENIDRDRGFRRVGPIKLERMYNESVVERAHFSHGPFDDACAKRFFFGQYPFVLETGRAYRLNVSNTMPNNARIRFHSTDASEKVLLLIYYYNDNLALRVVQKGQEVTPLERLPTLADGRAANAYPGGNTYYLVLQGSPVASEQIYDLRVVNKVQLNLTMTISVVEFFAKREAIVSNLAILLDIPASRIKVVGVHEVTQDTARQDAIDQSQSQSKSQSQSSIGRGRRESTGALDVEIEILSALNGTATTDEQSEEDVEELNTIVETLTNKTESGELQESMAAEANVTVSGIAVTPPAGNGVSTSAFSVTRTTTTTAAPIVTTVEDITSKRRQPDDPIPPSRSSSSQSTATLAASIGGAGVVVLAMFAFAISRPSKAKSKLPRPSAVKEIPADSSQSDGAVGVTLTEPSNVARDKSKRYTLAQTSLPGSPSVVSQSFFEISVQEDDGPAEPNSPALNQGTAVDCERTPSRHRKEYKGLLQRLTPSLTRRSKVASVVSSSSMESLSSSEMEVVDADRIIANDVSLSYSLQAMHTSVHSPDCPPRDKSNLTSPSSSPDVAHPERTISRFKWEYVSMHDWYHPTIGSETAQSIVREKPIGTFLIYGRLHLFLCVRSAANIVRHDAIEHSSSNGYQLHLPGTEQPWFEDLASLVLFHTKPRVGVPFILLTELENSIHFVVPNGISLQTTCEEQHVAEPVYTDDDLARVSCAVTKRTKRDSIQLKAQLLKLRPVFTSQPRVSDKEQLGSPERQPRAALTSDAKFEMSALTSGRGHDNSSSLRSLFETSTV